MYSQSSNKTVNRRRSLRSYSLTIHVSGSPLQFCPSYLQAEGLTAIEAWVIVCVLFVFGALIEYAGLLLKMKLATTR